MVAVASAEVWTTFPQKIRSKLSLARCHGLQKQASIQNVPPAQNCHNCQVIGMPPQQKPSIQSSRSVGVCSQCIISFVAQESNKVKQNIEIIDLMIANM